MFWAPVETTSVPAAATMRSKYDKADHSPFYRWFVEVGEEAQERFGRVWFVIE